MNAFLLLGFSFLLLSCAHASTQGPECEAGCHQQHGFCEQSGECRCRPGWRGAACDQCVPSSACAHGTCEEPGQCICERGWTGARCDRDARCSSQPCPGSSTCVEVDGEGHVCLCSAGHPGGDCQLKTGPCAADGSRCQNGGTCVSSSGSDSRPSCVCPAGFSGALCEIPPDVCEPNPCVNGGSCVRGDPGYTCACPPRFSGPTCELHMDALKLKARVKAQHLPLHKLLRPGPASAPLVSRSQLICFAVLGLLTCLVVLVTTGLIFFPRCEAWLANSRYRRLVQQQRNLGPPPVNIILPEKIRLSNYERLYTSM